MYYKDPIEGYDLSGPHNTGYCANCGEDCQSITIDQGIGHCEYWGFVGNHRDVVEVSPCCECEVILVKY